MKGGGRPRSGREGVGDPHPISPLFKGREEIAARSDSNAAPACSSRIALRAIRATGYCGACLRAGLARQLVGAFVGRVAGVTPQPVPIYFVALERRVEPLPQVDVDDRLLAGGAPAVVFPDMDPFGDAAVHILAVGIKLDDARTLERLERRDGGGELHAIVGRMRLAALELALMAVPGEHRAPAAGPGIFRAGAVGMNDHVPRVQRREPFQSNP